MSLLLNGDEDIASNNYYDAKETLVDHKKKKMQSLKKVSSEDEGSSDSSFNMSSVSSSINTN